MHENQHNTLNSLAIEATSDGIWGWHIPSGKATFSPQYYTMLGYMPDEFPANFETWAKLLHPDDVAPTTAHIEEYLEKREGSYEVEFRLKTKQGNYLWILGRGKITEWDEDGEPVYLVGSHVNIDKHKRAEEKLARYQEQLEELINERTEALQQTSSLLEATLNAIPDVIGIQDNSHRIIGYNEAGYQFLNKSHEEVVGKRCYELIGQKGECEHCATSISYKTKKPAALIRYEEALGAWLDVRAYPIVDNEGNISRVIEHLRDITTEKEAEEEKRLLQKQLMNASKMEALGTLAGGIAHDFNNLLMGIQGRISLLELERHLSESSAEHLQAVSEYIRGAADLTKQLLGFARGGKYQVKPIDINEMVSSTSTMFGRTKKDVEIVTELSAEPIVVEAGKRQLEQVLLNLYINGSQAMAGGGTLTLKTAKIALKEKTVSQHNLAPGKYAEITIADTGTGMDEATRQRIFEPFFTTKDKGRGTGLGLASAYGIIKHHGGMIRVSSTPGQGSNFSILLPISDEKVVVEVKPSASVHQGKGSVLLVDDEQMILDVGQRMIEALGYNVVVAKGGEQAITQLDSSGDSFDLVILDMVMPSVDGSKVFAHIKATRPELAVLLSSGYTVDGEAASLIKQGCQGFIQKPFTITELSEKIQSIL